MVLGVEESSIDVVLLELDASLELDIS